LRLSAAPEFIRYSSSVEVARYQPPLESDDNIEALVKYAGNGDETEVKNMLNISPGLANEKNKVQGATIFKIFRIFTPRA